VILWEKGLTANNIHIEIVPVYGGKCLTRKAVHSWVDKFSQVRSKVADGARPGRPIEIVTEATAQRVERFIRADRRITIDSVATALGCSHGVAHSTMHDGLKFRKVCTRWVPREQKDRETNERMSLSLQHLLRYADEGEDTSILKIIFTGDESWVHHYQPESKRASMQWKHPSSPPTKNFKVTPSAGKFTLTVFWDCQRVLLTHFQKRGENMNSASYFEALLKLRDAIHRKRSGQLARGLLLHHDNVRPNTARATQERIQELQ
jgi:hypothetical protein